MAKLVNDTISATELVRNLSVAIDRVRLAGQSLSITKGSQTVAKLSPPPKSGLPINKLAGLLAALPKSIGFKCTPIEGRTHKFAPTRC